VVPVGFHERGVEPARCHERCGIFGQTGFQKSSSVMSCVKKLELFLRSVSLKCDGNRIRSMLAPLRFVSHVAYINCVFVVTVS